MKAMKVFVVTTAIIVDNQEVEQMDCYNVLGETLEKAIIAAKKLMGKGEYVISAEHKLTLD